MFYFGDEVAKANGRHERTGRISVELGVWCEIYKESIKKRKRTSTCGSCL